jgi:hypothetical protein
MLEFAKAGKIPFKTASRAANLTGERTIRLNRGLTPNLFRNHFGSQKRQSAFTDGNKIPGLLSPLHQIRELPLRKTKLFFIKTNAHF